MGTPSRYVRPDAYGISSGRIRFIRLQLGRIHPEAAGGAVEQTGP